LKGIYERAKSGFDPLFPAADFVFSDWRAARYTAGRDGSMLNSS